MSDELILRVYDQDKIGTVCLLYCILSLASAHVQDFEGEARIRIADLLREVPSTTARLERTYTLMPKSKDYTKSPRAKDKKGSSSAEISRKKDKNEYAPHSWPQHNSCAKYTLGEGSLLMMHMMTP